MSSTSCAVPISALPDQMLEKALDCAINEEDYETASAIRDEIERRKSKRVNNCNGYSYGITEKKQ